jgi:hypothetical protein
MKLLAVVVGVLLAELVAAAEISVTSRCPYPIWVSHDGNPSLPFPNARLDPGAMITWQIPGSWISGRMWPKIQCDGSGNNCLFGQSSPPCPSDGCQPPADTKVEFTIFQDGQAWYDVSLVDGYSIAATIVPSREGGDCVRTNCNLHFDQCPTNEDYGIGDLRVYRHGQGVACLSPCKKWNYPPPYGFGRDEMIPPGVDMCCPTPPIWPEQCRTGPVVNTQYVHLVHRNCPSAYSYAYDDDAGLHYCQGGVNFAVTFCP